MDKRTNGTVSGVSFSLLTKDRQTVKLSAPYTYSMCVRVVCIYLLLTLT